MANPTADTGTGLARVITGGQTLAGAASVLRPDALSTMAWRPVDRIDETGRMVASYAEAIDVSTARELWKAGDTFVDVRSPEEYAQGHLPGAVNVPLDRIPLAAEQLPPGQVVTVCSMGQRSWRGAEAFARRGRTALSLQGGIKAWQAAGLPVETGT